MQTGLLLERLVTLERLQKAKWCCVAVWPLDAARAQLFQPICNVAMASPRPAAASTSLRLHPNDLQVLQLLVLLDQSRTSASGDSRRPGSRPWNLASVWRSVCFG